MSESDVVYVLGDIHGRLDLLLKAEGLISILKTRIPSNSPSVRLIGDYVDHGPDSKGVMDRIIGSQLAGLPMISMLGNHDIWLSRVVHKIRANDPVHAWIDESTLATVRSYGVRVDSYPHMPEEEQAIMTRFARRVPQEHLDYIRDYMSPLSIDAGAIFVHAGLNPKVGLNRQDMDVCISGPDIRGGFPESGWDGGENGLPVIMGHLVQSVPLVSRNLKIACIDTGAHESGILTCGIISSGKISGFLSVVQKGGLDFVPVVVDNPKIPHQFWKLVARWWQDVFRASKEPPVLVFADEKRKQAFASMTKLENYREASNPVSFTKKGGFRKMPPILVSGT